MSDDQPTSSEYRWARQVSAVLLIAVVVLIVVLALATGVVGAMLRDRDALREDHRRHQAYLLAFLEQLEATYHQVKPARRLLRTFGFDSPTTLILTAEQATGFRAQMALLNEAELTFETHARKVAAMPGPWGAEWTSLTTELTGLYQYLHRLLTEWQTDPTVSLAGGDTSPMQGGRTSAVSSVTTRSPSRLSTKASPTG